MPDIETIRTWEGCTLLDRDGGRIGTIDAIYLDDRTGQPEWAVVNTGLFGTKSSFVPLAQAFQSDNDVLITYNKQLVNDAPGLTPTSRCRRPRSGSCGSTMASTTTLTVLSAPISVSGVGSGCASTSPLSAWSRPSPCGGSECGWPRSSARSGSKSTTRAQEAGGASVAGVDRRLPNRQAGSRTRCRDRVWGVALN
jgi:hypothetical protein